MIEPRNVQFDFAATPRHWHSGDPGISHFYNGLSLTFPEGERFFVESVRRFASDIDEPALAADARAFTAQEGAHAREHERYNAWLESLGLEPGPIERLQRFGLRKVLRRFPAKMQLAITCALEHYTALFAEVILSDPRVMEGAAPEMRDLWRWHALEEAEHRAVAFDVHRAVSSPLGGYLRRCLAMTMTTIDFNLAAFLIHVYLLRKDGRLTDGKSWAAAFRHLWLKPGVWRRVLCGVPGYYRPGFHPSDRGDRLLSDWAGRYRPGEKPGSLFAA